MISTAVWKTLLGLPPFPQARRFIFNLYLIQGGGPNQSIKVGQIKLSKPHTPFAYRSKDFVWAEFIACG
jgi:hypothetical protein